MTYEEEIQKLQEEALGELGENEQDTNTNDSEQEESTGDTFDERKDEGDREYSTGNEDEDDQAGNSSENENVEEEGETNSKNEDESNEKDKSKEENKDFSPVEVEVNGQTITLDSQEELITFVKKMQQKSGLRSTKKSINDRIVEQGKLSKEDLALLVDAKNGSKEAIAKLAKNSGVDIYDIDEDAADTYSPKFEPQEPTEVEEVAEEILANEQLHQKFQNIAKTIPQDFAQVLASDAKALRNFANHVERGLAEEIIPQATKATMLGEGTFLENYVRIGQEISARSTGQQNNKAKEARKKDPRAEELRKRARNPKGSNKGTKTKVTGDDIWSMSSEDFFEKFMN